MGDGAKANKSELRMEIVAGVKAGESGKLNALDCVRNGEETVGQS